ncbi:hypothetical protein SAMN04490248_10132 [Salinihabitans flavidus]|uniref:DUF2062 domain-containing protein n=1 Tax=Salinihabitans flavidus TaxID=569882 RepID=A0A1H8L8G9_9RHOB|nr:DUF2062 domain-containing protein [Salinihabitans flavidus]SEO01401.1 hypothetical protein SAMN04490248_10132 [Salinihabitans flavidus]
MVFKRRDRRPILQTLLDFLWPRGGWTRAFHYVKHRLHRLPGSPEFIGRGIWAGVFVCFTPLFGLHFVLAILISRIVKGSVLASLLATFVGNPLTFLPIGVISLKTGHFLLGTMFDERVEKSLVRKFTEAWGDLWHNFVSLFSDQRADWHALLRFHEEVFFPYLVGGIIPGIIAASVAYYLSVPVIRAYQKRRAGRLKSKLDALRKKALHRSKKKKDEIR